MELWVEVCQSGTWCTKLERPGWCLIGAFGQSSVIRTVLIATTAPLAKAKPSTCDIRTRGVGINFGRNSVASSVARFKAASRAERNKVPWLLRGNGWQSIITLETLCRAILYKGQREKRMTIAREGLRIRLKCLPSVSAPRCARSTLAPFRLAAVVAGTVQCSQVGPVHGVGSASSGTPAGGSL